MNLDEAIAKVSALGYFWDDHYENVPNGQTSAPGKPARRATGKVVLYRMVGSSANISNTIGVYDTIREAVEDACKWEGIPFRRFKSTPMQDETGATWDEHGPVLGPQKEDKLFWGADHEQCWNQYHSNGQFSGLLKEMIEAGWLEKTPHLKSYYSLTVAGTSAREHYKRYSGNDRPPYIVGGVNT